MRVCPFDEQVAFASFRSAAAAVRCLPRLRAAVRCVALGVGVGWDACNVRVRIDVDMYKM